VAKGLKHAVAAAAGVGTLLALLYGLGFTLLVSAVTAAVVWGAVLVFAPAPGPLGSRAKLAAELVRDAEPMRQRLLAASRVIQHHDTRGTVTRLVALAEEIGGKLKARPETLGRVSRFFTYYLPQAAAFAEGYRALEMLHDRDTERMRETAALLAKLEHAFRHYADSMVESGIDSLDVEMKLLRQSLEGDIGALPEPPPREAVPVEGAAAPHASPQTPPVGGRSWRVGPWR
jgi:hypothetical protein